MKRFVTSFVATVTLALCASAAFADQPGWSYIQAHFIQNAGALPLASGQLCVQGQPSNFSAGNGGIIISPPACVPITNGAIADNTLRVPDSAFTGPRNVRYSIARRR